MVSGTGSELATTRSQSTAVTGLTIYDRVDPMDFIDKMGLVYARTGAGGAQTENDGKLLALACICRRVDVFELTRTHHLISGKLSKKSETILGDFHTAGGESEWIADGTDGRIATLQVKWKGKTSKYSFTIEMAKAAGYIKKGSNWEKRPDQQLRARCVTDLIRMVAPEIIAGEYSQEELEDIPALTATASSAASAATAPARSADQVKARQAELAAMNGASTQQSTSQLSTPAAKKDEAIVDAEFTPTPTTTPTTTTETTPVPLGDAADLPAHTQQAGIMEVELMVGQLGWTVPQVVQQINAGRAKKNESAIEELGQLEPANMQALVGNLRKLIEKKLAAEGVPFATS